MKYNYTGISHVGNVRANNEDNFFIGKTLNNKKILLAVVDGIGGGANGELASGIVAEDFQWFMSKQENVNVEELKNQITDTNTEIFNYYHDKGIRGGTTLAGMLIDDKSYILNIGDSRVYLIRDGDITQLTWDHNLANFQLKAGKIKTADELGKKGQALVRAIGIDEKCIVDFIPVDMKAGDRFLICSDGLYDEVQEETILYLSNSINDIEDLKEMLLNKVLSGDAKDNVTFIVLEVVE